MNVLSLVDIVTALSDELLNEDVIAASLIPEVDFDELITDVTVAANDALAGVNEVVEATTELVVTTFEDLGVDVDTLDVSSIVQDVVNFIAELPEDATIVDALDSVDVPGLSEDQLSELLMQVSELIDSNAPNLSQLSVAPVLEESVDFVGELLDGVGTIAINGSSLSGELTLDGETRSFTTDISDEANFLADISEFLSDITGDANLADGQFIGEVTIEDTQYGLNLDITQTLTDTLGSLLADVETTLPFSNGAIAVDFETIAGDIEGTLDFAGGDLDLNLTTPFGDVDTSLPFPDDAQFEVPFELPGLPALDVVLDLSTGVLFVPFIGGVIPLESFSGELSLADGVAALTLDMGLPIPTETSFDLGPLAGEVAAALTEDLVGELIINAGVIDGIIMGEFGELSIDASLDDLVLEASGFIDETTGLLSLDEGTAGLSLNTPLGDLLGELVLAPMDDGSTTV